MTEIVIAHGGDIGFPGGGTNRVLTFAESLAENGYDVTLVVPKMSNKSVILKLDMKNIKLITIPIKSKSLKDQIARAAMVSLKAKKIVNRSNALLQIEHSTLGGVAAKIGCKNYVLDIHDIEFDGSLYRRFPLSSRFIYYLERKAVKNALRIIVVSKPMKDFLVNIWSVPESIVEIIPNGYFEEKFRDFCKSTEIPGLISFLGVFTHNIDYDKIIKLAQSLPNRAKIYMIGDGPMRKRFLKIIREKNIKNILAPGFLEDRHAYSIIAKSQICIFPLKNTLHSKVAGHMKTLDYAALGKAIATDRDGTALIFEQNRAALVSDPSNPHEFLNNVHILLENGNIRKKLGKRAKKLVKNFSWKKQGKKLVQFYDKYLSKTGGD